jgi:hypothetical protein
MTAHATHLATLPDNLDALATLHDDLHFDGTGDAAYCVCGSRELRVTRGAAGWAWETNEQGMTEVGTLDGPRELAEHVAWVLAADLSTETRTVIVLIHLTSCEIEAHADADALHAAALVREHPDIDELAHAGQYRKIASLISSGALAGRTKDFRFALLRVRTAS